MIITIGGIAVLCSHLVIMTIMFIHAYLSPSKRLSININYYNEALPELILILVLLPCGLYVIYKTIQGLLRGVPT